jgi:hypothetical protein
VVAVGRLDRLRVGVLELEGGVEELVVVGEPGDVLHLRLEVVAGAGFEPGVDPLDALPSGVGEVAVDGDRRADALDAQRRQHGGSRGGGRRGGLRDGRRNLRGGEGNERGGDPRREREAAAKRRC